ncbi:hypothetical protein, partial [Crocosphaera watsonii]|uniref:hypothetical protein n=1 Tax=Crocosphaera watsonii TaxID=263511 RepID=UPI000562821B
AQSVTKKQGLLRICKNTKKLMNNHTSSRWEQTSIAYNSAVCKSSAPLKYHRIPNPLWLSLKKKGEA